jgi:hypothetical protein
MHLVLSTLLTLTVQNAAPAGWTWTLYENEGPLVFAEEVPDTARLRTTLECQPGSGAVMLDIYDSPASDGFARITAADASATSEARVTRGRLETTVRVDHPAFNAFVASGRMTVSVGDSQKRVTVPPEHLARLRRFADRCAG